MLNDFINELEEFKKKCNRMSYEEFLISVLNLGIKFGSAEGSNKTKDSEYSIRKQLEEKAKKYDAVNKPSHYADSKIEVIDYIEDKRLGFCLGNAIKYISRAGKKKDNGRNIVEKEIEDLRKAIWYINRRIDELKNENISEFEE